jgi:hypothetical protein
MMNILYKFLPVEIVDMIYLRTDFFTAIKQIPDRKFIVDSLFKRDIHKTLRNGNWGVKNTNQVTITEILRRHCRKSLVYFKNAKPNFKIHEMLFKYDDNFKIIKSRPWNNLLISVYQIRDYELRHYEKRRRMRFSHTI